jgi:hypothetical protein
LQEDLHFWVPTIKVRPPDGIVQSPDKEPELSPLETEEALTEVDLVLFLDPEPDARLRAASSFGLAAAELVFVPSLVFLSFGPTGPDGLFCRFEPSAAAAAPLLCLALSARGPSSPPLSSLLNMLRGAAGSRSPSLRLLREDDESAASVGATGFFCFRSSELVAGAADGAAEDEPRCLDECLLSERWEEECFDFSCPFFDLSGLRECVKSNKERDFALLSPK